MKDSGVISSIFVPLEQKYNELSLKKLYAIGKMENDKEYVKYRQENALYKKYSAYEDLDRDSSLSYRGRSFRVQNVLCKWSDVRSTKEDDSIAWYCRSFDQALELLWRSEEEHDAYQKHMDSGGSHFTFNGGK